MKQYANLDDLKEFLLNAPLYSEYVTQSDSKPFLALYNKGDHRIDGHCPHCKAAATFIVKGHHIPAGTPWDNIEQRVSTGDQVSLVCTRNEYHWIKIFIRINRMHVQKVGQYPSIADIALDESKVYRSVLDKTDSSELHKSIGLAAHGIGVGSFVYLRRIFERLIYSRFNEHKSNNEWIEDDFNKLRMNEKVLFLRGYLPDFLVENSKIYSILSLGIHELDENQCLNYFDIMKHSIIIILDEDKRKKEETAKKEIFSKAIAGFKSANQIE